MDTKRTKLFLYTHTHTCHMCVCVQYVRMTEKNAKQKQIETKQRDKTVNDKKANNTKHIHTFAYTHIRSGFFSIHWICSWIMVWFFLNGCVSVRQRACMCFCISCNVQLILFVLSVSRSFAARTFIIFLPRAPLHKPQIFCSLSLYWTCLN